RWIIASQDETTGPSVHPEDATSTKGKGSATDVQAAKRIAATHDETTGPSAQPKDATSAKMVRDTLSHADAKMGVDSEKADSEADTKNLNIGEDVRMLLKWWL
ncbi:hypothetical protein Tco_1492087, partial [Tanacetum coccineum]